jgi:hypothetical protein
MFAWRKALGFGVLVWLIPFGVAFAVFPLRQGERPLFESIMAVAVAAATAVCAVLYLRGVSGGQGREAMRLGLLWLAMCVVIDQPLFMAGPMAMSFADYLKDIGVTYAMIPFITTGHGVLQERTSRS